VYWCIIILEKRFLLSIISLKFVLYTLDTSLCILSIYLVTSLEHMSLLTELLVRPSNLDSWSLDARCVACRFYGKLLSILIDVNYRRVWHAAVCRTRARHTACAVRCNGALRCNDATVLRVNSWESLDGAYRCRHPRRDTFGRSRKDRICTRVLIRIGQFQELNTSSVSKHRCYSCLYSDRRYQIQYWTNTYV